MLRHIRQLLKPAFTNLLAPATLIQIDDEIWRLGLEIGRRIIKRHVSIFANADESNVNRKLADNIINPLALPLRVSFRADVMASPHWQRKQTDKVFPEKSTKRSRVSNWHAHVLIQMKYGNVRPMNLLGSYQVL